MTAIVQVYSDAMATTYDKSQPSPGSEGTDSARQRPRPPLNRRRDKPQLSCNLCRRRKMRCDRHHPCSTCERRGLSSSCTYVTGGGVSTSSASVQDRLKTLETLVVSYMNQNEGARLNSLMQASPGTRELDASPAPSDVGGLKSSSTETKYHDMTHWDSVLDAISELKEDYSQSDNSRPTLATPEPPSISSLDSPLLYGCKHCSKDEILAALPSRELADSLVSLCFEQLQITSCAIHRLEFLKQYAAFWEDPQIVPVMWLGLLFSIFSIAINIRDLNAEQPRLGIQPDCASLSACYREKTAQCLILGQYTRGGPYVIETLVHHFTAEFVRRRHVSNETWLILSTAVHLAMRMGYHKDPDHFKSISPYEGELRRRLWAMIYNIDILTAGQLGLPRLINDSFVDTALPRNLLESDFGPDSATLPPSRPDSDTTPMLVTLSKFRLGHIYTAVADVVTNTQPPTYAQVLQVDRQIEDMFMQIPDYCRIKPATDSVTDSPQVILQRFFLEINYHKAQVILHWRYLSLANQDDRYAYSTKTATSAALKILKLHQTMYEGLKPDGRLYPIRWRVTCFLCQDYLLATSILCFYLQRNSDKISSSELDEIKRTIRTTKVIWDPRTPMLAEIKRVATAIELAIPGFLEHQSDESSDANGGQVLTPASSADLDMIHNEQDPFVGSLLPCFDLMFEGAPMFPSQINDMGTFIDSVLPGSNDPWCEVGFYTQDDECLSC
ncbi:hypothetical protein F5Y14DRAFT_436275 [Nemania sp. NC0429]|nr:hypothetical protein F5Y14DRAFT_436275 [Nemania sp. NC0429]